MLANEDVAHECMNGEMDYTHDSEAASRRSPPSTISDAPCIEVHRSFSSSFVFRVDWWLVLPWL